MLTSILGWAVNSALLINAEGIFQKFGSRDVCKMFKTIPNSEPGAKVMVEITDAPMVYVHSFALICFHDHLVT